MIPWALSRFERETLDYTDDCNFILSLDCLKIVLIDGQELARPMLENNIGVRSKMKVNVNRIDEDYLAERMNR